MSKRKAPSSDDCKNQDFSDFLTELATFERDVSRNIHKYNAYRKAASAIAQHPTRIKSGDEAKKLPGVGDKISKKIQEFIDTGSLQKLEKIRTDDASMAITQLTKVSGIGPAKARELYNSGIKSIEELRKNQDSLNHHQKLGLKFHEEIEKRIPRAEISEAESLITKECNSIDSDYKVTICGSYRRGAADSGDIDLLLSHPSFVVEEEGKGAGAAKGVRKPQLLHRVVEHLKKISFIRDTISLGDSKFMGVCRIKEDLPHRRLDIRLIPHNQFACALLYFTGSDLFNRTMRQHALEQGFTLNEYSLRPMGSTGLAGEPLPVSEEEDIFIYINFPYKKPEQRNL